jgi:hypothetical protein
VENPVTFDMRAVVFFVAVGTIAAPARAQQVTITIGGYGSPQEQVAAPPTQPTQPGVPSGGAGYGPYAGPVALAQMAAYGRYMQYLSVLNYQSTHNGALPGPDAKEYFTNGAAATTVPSAGPGSAYFNNGSEATVLQPATPPPLAPPPPPSQQPPGQSPWVVVYQNPNAPPPPPAPAPAPTPAPEAVADNRAPVVAMSFQDWLESMGLDNSDTSEESSPALTSGEVDTTPIAEPAALAYDVRQRVAYALPEKARARAAPHASGWGPVAGITSAFAAGLILGGLAMLRLRDRVRKDADAVSVPPPSM